MLNRTGLIGWLNGRVGSVEVSRMITRFDCSISSYLGVGADEWWLTVDITTRSLDVVRSSAGVVISSSIVCDATISSRLSSGAAKAVL